MYLHICVHLYDPKYSVRFYIVPKRATADCGPQPVRRAATGNIYACSPTSDQRRTWIYIYLSAHICTAYDMRAGDTIIPQSLAQGATESGA